MWFYMFLLRISVCVRVLKSRQTRPYVCFEGYFGTAGAQSCPQQTHIQPVSTQSVCAGA
ncbi:hypothetical protein Pcac1_g17085 [Phytophthora cactorum]|nr:hypothetical protein Pcac1_g17085 [Phytophthora cactorum]